MSEKFKEKRRFIREVERMALKRRTFEDIVLDTIIYLSLIIIFIVTFYPFYLSLILSLNEGMDATRGGIYFWPRKFTLDNYKRFFSDSRWLNAFFITTIRTITGTILTVFVTSMVAYALSFRRLVGRKVYITIIIISMYFSGGIIPYYVILRTFKLLDTFWVYIIPGCLNLFFVLVAISFFQGIPEELHESALIDGANDIRVLVSIVFPLSTPLLATIAIFTAVGHWNAWFDSAFFIKSNNLRTLGYMMISVINKANLPTGASAANLQSVGNITTTAMSVQLAAMIIAVAPILVIYPFLQRYFVAGLTIGSVKG